MEEYLRRLPILSQLAPAALDVCKHAVADKIQEQDRSEVRKSWKIEDLKKLSKILRKIEYLEKRFQILKKLKIWKKVH